jgi:hypothetical protein
VFIPATLACNSATLARNFAASPLTFVTLMRAPSCSVAS